MLCKSMVKKLLTILFRPTTAMMLNKNVINYGDATGFLVENNANNNMCFFSKNIIHNDTNNDVDNADAVKEDNAEDKAFTVVHNQSKTPKIKQPPKMITQT